MTLDNSYHDAMEHIHMTPELRQKVLDRLEQESEAPRKKNGRPRLKYWLACAACLAVVVAAAALVPRFAGGNTASEPGVMATAPEEYASAAELSDAVGFPIDDLTDLPFVPEETGYTAMGDGVAQIAYRRGADEVTYRKAVGADDISGDYNDYSDVQTVDVNGASVTVKGEGGVWKLAVWTRDGYSYSISVPGFDSVDELTALAAEAS